MLNRLAIKNFRGISALDVELVAAAVFVGPNSCGKTTVLQAVQLACAALHFAAEQRQRIEVADDGWLTLYSNRPLRDDQAFLPTTRWKELFLGANPDNAIEIGLHFSPPYAMQQLWLKLHQGRADALRMTLAIQIAEPLRTAFTAMRSGSARRSVKHDEALHQLLTPHLPQAVYIPAFYGVMRQEEYRARGAVEALLQSGEQAQVVRNLLLRLPGLEGINDFLPRAGLSAAIRRWTSLPETDQARFLEVVFTDRNGPLELASAGTGLVGLIALYAAIQMYTGASRERPVLFLLDEPEAHLHPRLQGDVAARLVEMIVTRAGAQLLCATHSVEMINRFGRDPAVAVLRINRDQEGVARALRSEDERLEELSAWCDLSPFAQLNLLATRRLLFHEGPTDYQILSGCAGLYLGNDPSRLQRFRDFVPAPLSGTGNLTAKDVLKVALLPVFKQLPPGERIRVVRLLDRDTGRTPGSELRRDDEAHYEELDQVWSRHSIESLFLDPECLTDWLHAALAVPERPAVLDRPAVLSLVQAAVAAADGDDEMNQEAVAQLMPRLVTGRSNMDMTRAIAEARARVKTEPAVLQRGHDRARFVLNHIRGALLAEGTTRGLARLVRRDIAQIVVHTQLRPNLLLPPALFPPELKQVLDFMAA